MYNIAKVAKGEILVYFNQVFDALCKVRTLTILVSRMLTRLYSLLPTQSYQSRTEPSYSTVWSRTLFLSLLHPTFRFCTTQTNPWDIQTSHPSTPRTM
jgi:hypothetical protein